MKNNVFVPPSSDGCLSFGGENAAPPSSASLRLRVARSVARSLHADQRGQTSLEWALLLGAVAIPSLYLIRLLLSILSWQYQMVSFLETLPFP